MAKRTGVRTTRMNKPRNHPVTGGQNNSPPAQPKGHVPAVKGKSTSVTSKGRNYS